MPATNKNKRTKEFKQQFDVLPARIQKLARAAYKQFLLDPSHPSLCLHQLADIGRGRHRCGSFSVYVTMKYPAIYVVDDGVNIWYWIGTHNDYENFTGQK